MTYYKKPKSANYILIFYFLLIGLAGSSSAQDEELIELVSIEFEGNETIESDELIAIISSKESPGWFSQFFNGISENFGSEAVYFDSLALTSDVQAIKDYYFDKGFFKTRVYYSYDIDADGEEAELLFLITEDQPGYFRSFEISNLNNISKELSDKITEEIIALDTTQQYDGSIVEAKISQINSYMRDHGHMLVSNEQPVVTIDTVINKVDINIEFDFGLRYHISEVIVNKTGEGKDLVSDDLIKSLVKLKRGDFYSFYETQLGQTRLYRTNLFTTTLVTGKLSDTLKNTVPLSISSDIGLLNEFFPEILINDDNGLNIGFGLNYHRKNFFGDARKLNTGISAAARNPTEFITKFSLQDTLLFGYADVRMSLEQPFIFGRPINTTLETFLTLQKRKEEWNATIFGAEIRFDIELPRYTYLTSMLFSFQWENSKFVFKEKFIKESLTNFLQRSSLDTLLPQLKNSDIADVSSETANSAVLGVSLGANKTNNLLFPTRGYSLSILAEDGNFIPYAINKIGSSEFSNPVYYKVVVSSSIYIPAYKEETSALGIKLKAGHMHAYKGSSSRIPLNQRFSSGGSNSIRGWNALDLNPEAPTPANLEDLLSNLDNITVAEFEQIFLRGLTPGGFFQLESSIETRNRLFGSFGTALFVDFGNTWSNYRDVQLNSFAVAAGIGFRYYSDFAPFRLDFGFKVYDPSDKRWLTSKKVFEQMAFHIGIGEAF